MIEEKWQEKEFRDLPKERQGLGLYTGWGMKEIKRMERKIKKIYENIAEAKRRLNES